MSVVEKDYSAILENQTRAIVEWLLNENQSGFCPMHGCQDQILHEINVLLNKNCIPRSMLWSVLVNSRGAVMDARRIE